MRSARTDRPAPPAESPAATGTWRAAPARPRSSGGWRFVAFEALAWLAVLVFLSACAGSSAQDARRGQARDGAKTPVLPETQSTRTTQRFFPTATPPTPTPPPLPSLATLAMTLAVGGDGAPQGNYASIPADAGTAYAAVELRGVSEGQVVAARWVDATGGTVSTSNLEIEADADQVWVGLPLALDGTLPPGEYAVYVFVGDRRLNSLLFRVDPAGSGGTLQADPPTDPRADRGGPGQPPPGQGGQLTPGAAGQPVQGIPTPAPGAGQGVVDPLTGAPMANPEQVPAGQVPAGQVPAGQVPAGQVPAGQVPPVQSDAGAVPIAPVGDGAAVPTQTP